MERIAEETANAVTRYASSGRGPVPGFLKQWAEEFTNPPAVHWTEKLEVGVGHAKKYKQGHTKDRYNKISRRQYKFGKRPFHNKPLLPNRVDPVPTIAVVGDTSASMGKIELSYIAGTIKGIVDATGAEVMFCACDARAGDVTPIQDWSEIADLLTGGGGTAFGPAFDALEEEMPQPTTIVYITDGGGTAPDEQPDWIDQVIWCLVGPYKQKPDNSNWKPIDWGTFIEIDE